MSVNARKEQYEHVELFGKSALFTDPRIDRSTVSEEFHCYDLRGSTYDPGKPVTVENQVAVIHTDTVPTAELVTSSKNALRRLRGKLKADLKELVSELRENGPLKNLSTMTNYCGNHGGEFERGYVGYRGCISIEDVLATDGTDVGRNVTCSSCS